MSWVSLVAHFHLLHRCCYCTSLSLHVSPPLPVLDGHRNILLECLPLCSALLGPRSRIHLSVFPSPLVSLDRPRSEAHALTHVGLMPFRKFMRGRRGHSPCSAGGKEDCLPLLIARGAKEGATLPLRCFGGGWQSAGRSNTIWLPAFLRCPPACSPRDGMEIHVIQVLQLGKERCTASLATLRASRSLPPSLRRATVMRSGCGN